MSKNKGLAEQDLSKLDVAQLHPLSPEVISRQATINIGIDTDAKETEPYVSLKANDIYNYAMYLRNHWPCRSREVDNCESYFRCAHC